MRLSIAFSGCALLLLAGSVLPGPAINAQDLGTNWHSIFQERLPLYGHRNWIVIADSAYPAQSSNGIETIVSNAEYFQVLQTVLSGLSRSRHVKPIPYVDRELAAISEDDAPGISGFRSQLSGLLNNVSQNAAPISNLRHEQIIAKLNEVSQNFRILIIKTNLTLPYTSVFLQLDCAYWGPDAERRLRSAMAAQR